MGNQWRTPIHVLQIPLIIKFVIAVIKKRVLKMALAGKPKGKMVGKLSVNLAYVRPETCLRNENESGVTSASIKVKYHRYGTHIEKGLKKEA